MEKINQYLFSAQKQHVFTEMCQAWQLIWITQIT